MKKIYLGIIFFTINTILANAQYTQVFSQYMFNGLAINPAYAGSREALSITALYRNQWTGMEGAPSTTTLSIHSPLKKEKIALGLLMYYDKYGVTGQTAILGNYAYRITTGKGKLSLGIQAGMIFQRYHWEKIHTIQNNDPVFTGTDRSTLPTTGTGLYYYTDRFFAGISAPHLLLLEGNSDLYKNNIRYKTYFVTAGYTFNLSPEVKIKPSVLLKYMKSGKQVDLNSWILYREKFGAGLSYRSRDAMVFLLSFQANKQLSVGYSYDRSFKNLSNYNNGSHEVVLTYDFRYIVKVPSPRSF